MRRWATLLLLGLAAWTAGAALGTGAPKHGSLARAAVAPVVELGLAHPHEATGLPTLVSRNPIFILVLGSDARQGEPIAGERSDSIHILGINAREHRASILGFPRDSWVSIPGHGMDKINAALTDGGPLLTVRTVEQLTGIHIDYYLLTSFWGLTNMVNTIGGVVVDVPYPMHDSYSGANFNAGRQRLNGQQALALSRNRHDTPNGDLSRSLNQGILLRSALAQLHGDFARNPSVLLTWIAAGVRNVATNLSIPQLLSLAFTALQVPPPKVRNEVVPASTGTVGGASVVFISGSARSVYRDMRRDGLIGK